MVTIFSGLTMGYQCGLGRALSGERAGYESSDGCPFRQASGRGLGDGDDQRDESPVLRRCTWPRARSMVAASGTCQ